MSRTVEIDGVRIETGAERFAHLRERLADAQPGAAPARVCFAAAHVVLRDDYAAVPHSLERPGRAEEIAEFVDLDATAQLRRHLDARGFGIAEAMDTAQRFELGWPGAARLIELCGQLELPRGFVAGVSCDNLAEPPEDEQQLVAALAAEAQHVLAHGGVPVLLPQVWLLERGYDAAGFERVYGQLFAAIPGESVVHWLGAMFAPALDGYFPDGSFERILAAHPQQAKACKLSLLDDRYELAVRRACAPRGQVVMTGDDFHFGELILGGDPHDAERGVPPVTGHGAFGGRPLPLGDFSHALLGILDGIAVPFGQALRLLAMGDAAGYREIAAPCEELGRHVFAAPTFHYKAGLAFLAWLNGLQDNFLLVNHVQRCRDRAHYVEVARLAGLAGALFNAETCAERLRQFDLEHRD